MSYLAERARLIAVLVVMIGLVFLGALNLRDRLGAHPIADDGVRWVDSKDGVTVRSIEASSPLQLSLSKGDRLRYIFLNGKYEPIDHAETVKKYLERVGPGAHALYAIERDDLGLKKILGAESPLFDVEFNVQTADQNLGRGLYLAFVGLVYLAISIFVLSKQTRIELTYHFVAWFLASFVVYFYSSLYIFTPVDKLVDFLDTSGFAILAPLFLHFCIRFPSRPSRRSWRRWALPVLYVPAAAFIVGEFLFHYVPQAYPAGSLKQVRTILEGAELAQYALFFLAGSLSLVWSFVRAETPILRQQLKWIVWGLGLSVLPFVILYPVPFILDLEIPQGVQTAAFVPLILIPLSFGYSIIRYRLMDVDVIMRRSMVHAVATLSVGAIYMAVLLGVGDMVKAIWVTADLNSWSTRAVVVAGMLVVTMLFSPIKNRLNLWVDQWFYGDRYTLRTGLQEFGKMLAQTRALPDLLDSVVRRLSEMLSIRQVAIFIEDPTARSGFTLAHSLGASESRSALPANVKQIMRVRSMGRGFVSADDLFESGNSVDQGEPRLVGSSTEFESATAVNGNGRSHSLSYGADLLRDQLSLTDEPLGHRNGFHYYVPCVVRDRMVAIIGLARSSSGALLTTEDTDLLRALSGYVAIALENSLLYLSQQEKSDELARLKEFSESIIESVSVGILVVDLDGQITTWNSACEEMFGIDRSRAMGRVVSDVLDPAFLDSVTQLTGPDGWAVTEVRQAYKCPMRAADNRQLACNIALAPFEAARGVVTGTLIVVENVTDRINLEQQLQQKEKLSSIGLLAAGVAHEVNTPLAGISSYAQMLLQQVPPGDPKHQLLEKIQAQTVRASGIVNNLLNFSRTGDTVLREIDVHRVLEDTLQLLDPQLRNSGVTIDKQFAIELPATLGNPSKLQQVFMNLILNARDAMPGGGVLTIGTTLSDGVLGIEFRDTGIGIATEHIARIYDPFFTTKAVGKGTGLGLALSYGIVQEHDGRITVQSRPGEGATFTVELPTVLGRQMQAASD